MRIVVGLVLTLFLYFFSFQSPSTSVEIVHIAPPVVEPSAVYVSNMIPSDQSDETGQDSEPFIAVDSTEKLFVGAVYYGSVAATQASPLFLSTDEGKTWQLSRLVRPNQNGPQSYCFSGNGTSLYGSIAVSQANNQQGVSVLYTENPQTGQFMEGISDLGSPGGGDQPFIQACACPVKDNAKSVDRIYVGQNYFGTGSGKTASVRVSLDGGKKFKLLVLELRSTGSAGQDGPSVRPAIANDGTVYVAFFRWTAKAGQNYVGDVVITRADDGAVQENSFNVLTDPSDGLPGRIIVSGRTFPFGQYLGQQKIGSPLSLAVDRNNSANVYIAWTDFDRPLRGSVLHLKRSTDRGQTWSDDLLTIPSATNPALATASDGSVGLLYQQLQGGQSGQRWETHFRRSPDGVGGWTGITTLATFPTATEPTRVYEPYLGYKVHLLTVGNNFYGVFSAPNLPEQRYFPKGVEFQRNHKEGKLFSKDWSRPIAVSIDPYFFKISGPPNTSPPSASATPTPLADGQSSVSLVSRIGLPVLLALGGLLAGFGSLELIRAKKTSREFGEKILGPAVTNYHGFVSVHFTNLRDELIAEITPGAPCKLVIEFGQAQPEESWAEKIDLSGGVDAREVVFKIVLDAFDFEVIPSHRTVSVPAKGQFSVSFEGMAKPDSPSPSVFVQVFHKTQLVQVVVPQLKIRQRVQ